MVVCNKYSPSVGLLHKHISALINHIGLREHGATLKYKGIYNPGYPARQSHNPYILDISFYNLVYKKVAKKGNRKASHGIKAGKKNKMPQDRL